MICKSRDMVEETSDTASAGNEIELPQPARNRKPRRFPLRSLLLFACVIAGAVWLWTQWTPWSVWRRLGGHVQGYDCRDALFSPDGRRAYTAGENGGLIWDVQTGRRLHALGGHERALAVIAVSPDGRHAATHDFGRRLRVWDARSGRLVQEISKLPYRALDVLFTPTGDRLLTIQANTRGGPCTAHLWDVRTGRQLARFVGHRSVIRSAGFWPNGERLVTGGGDGEIRIWETQTGKYLHVLTGHTAMVVQIEPSRDGSRVVSWSTDNTRREWDAVTGESLAVILLQPSVAFLRQFSHSPDGTRVVVPGMRLSGPPHLVYVLDAASGGTLATLETSPHGWVSSAVFSPDGRAILVKGQGQDSLIFRRRRPEWLWGVFWLKEFWATAILSLLLVWSLWRDRKIIARHESQVAGHG